MPAPKTGPIPAGSKVIAYARVSTDEQLKSGYSLQEQAERLRQYAADYGLVLDDDALQLESFTGTQANRPQLNDWSPGPSATPSAGS